MFIYTLKASTLKLFAAICLSLVAVITLIAFIPATTDDMAVMQEKKIDYTGVATNENRISFLSQFGWEVKGEPVNGMETVIPSEFDSLFSGYNEIQKKQGLDLSEYKGKKIMKYTYEITNYPNYEGKVYANLLIYRNRVIGGDICSAEITGFIHGFEK